MRCKGNFAQVGVAVYEKDGLTPIVRILPGTVVEFQCDEQNIRCHVEMQGGTGAKDQVANVVGVPCEAW